MTQRTSPFKYLFLLQQLVSREIKIRYKRSVLGMLWSLLNPLLMMVVLNAIFSFFFKFSIPNFLVYYLTGQVVFSLLQDSTAGGLYAIIGNSWLISKVYIPAYVFPLAKAIAGLVNNAFAILAMIIIAIATGVHFTFWLFLIPVLYIMLFVFVFGFVLFFSALAVYFRDLVQLHPILMLIWMYMTPIFYPTSILPPQLSWIEVVNPIFPYVQFMRDIALEGFAPDFKTWVLCLSFAIVSCLLGWVVFRSSRKNFILYL